MILYNGSLSDTGKIYVFMLNGLLMASDIEILISLLESTKKDIITVVNAQTKAISDDVNGVRETVLKQNSRIGKLEDRIYPLEETSLTRGLTCAKTLEELKPSREVVKAVGWVARNKKVSFATIILTLFLVQSAVYFVFKYAGVLEFIQTIYK